MKIAFTGWAGSGKTEASKFLCREYGFTRLSFADGIKQITRGIFNVRDKNRKLLQQVGEKMREIDPDVWVKHTMNRILPYKSRYVIDDLRRKNEFDALVENNFYIFRIVADEDVRIKRLIDRDGFCDTALLYNDSENGCADIDLFEIENNGSLNDMYSELNMILQKLYYKELLH